MFSNLAKILLLTCFCGIFTQNLRVLDFNSDISNMMNNMINNNAASNFPAPNSSSNNNDQNNSNNSEFNNFPNINNLPNTNELPSNFGQFNNTDNSNSAFNQIFNNTNQDNARKSKQSKTNNSKSVPNSKSNEDGNGSTNSDTNSDNKYDSNKSNANNDATNFPEYFIPTNISVHNLTSSLNVVKNLNFSIGLEGNPTTGYCWVLLNANTLDKSILKPLNINSQLSTDNYLSQPTNGHIVGVGGNYTFEFSAAKQGKITLEFAYKKVWENDANNYLDIVIEISDN